MCIKRKGHVCKSCGKKLLPNEKFPICLRCRLSGRNKAGGVAGGIGTGLAAIFTIKTIVDQQSNSNEDNDNEQV